MSSRTFAALGARTGLRRVLLAWVFFGLIEFYSWIVVVLWTYDVGGAGLAGLAAIVQTVPAALLAPAIAGLGDRLPRGTALALAYAFIATGCVLTWLSLAAGAPVAVVIAASALTTTAISTTRPIHFAALPQLAAASPAQLVSANALSSVIDGSVRFIGPVLAGIAYVAVGPASAMVLAAAVAVVPVLLCVRLGLAAPAGSDEEESGLRAALEGVRALWGDWATIALLLVMAVDFLIGGAFDILGVVYADDVLGEGEVAAGLLIGALGVGALVGAFIGGALAEGRRLARVVVLGAAVEGAAFLVLAVLGLLVPAMVALAVSGTAGAITLVAGRTLLQRTADDRILARVFAVQESISLLGIALGAALVPLLVTWLGAAGAVIPLGLGCLLLALACWRSVARLDLRARYLPAELALLREVPFVDALPPYDVERLARRGRWIDVPAGEVVVRQGDDGHEFFGVGVGEVSVTIDGVRKPGTIGSGGYFGEIALLRAIPRTATITAETPCRLFVLDARDFLAAVTGGTDGSAVAFEVSQAYEDLKQQTR